MKKILQLTAVFIFLIVDPSYSSPGKSAQILMGGRSSLNLIDGFYAVPFGGMGSAYQDQFLEAYQPLPTDGVLCAFNFYTTAAPGIGSSWKATWVLMPKGSSILIDTPLSAEVSDLQTASSELIPCFHVNRGDRLSIRTDSTGTPVKPLGALWNVKFYPDIVGERVMFGMTNAGTPGGALNDDDEMQIEGNNSPSNDKKHTSAQLAPAGAIFKKPIFEIQSSLGYGRSWNVTFQKEKVNSSLNVNLSDITPTAEDLVNSVHVEQGDLISWAMDAINSAPRAPAFWGVVYVPDYPDDFFYLFSNPIGKETVNWTVAYSWVSGLIQTLPNLGYPSSGRLQLAGDIQCRALCVSVDTGPGEGYYFDFDAMADGVPTGLKTVIVDNNTKNCTTLEYGTEAVITKGQLIQTRIFSSVLQPKGRLFKMSYACIAG